MNYIVSQKVRMGIKSLFDTTESEKEFALDALFVHTKYISFSNRNDRGVHMDVTGQDYIRKVLQRIGPQHRYKWHAENQDPVDVCHITFQTRKLRMKFLPNTRKWDEDTTLYLCNQKKHLINVTKVVENLPLEIKLMILRFLLGVKSVNHAVQKCTLFRSMNIRYFRFRNYRFRMGSFFDIERQLRFHCTSSLFHTRTLGFVRS